MRKSRPKLCPQRQDEPKRRTKRLDHVPTRTRLARRDALTTFRLAWGLLNKTPRPPRNLRLARPWVELVDPPHSPTLRQKSEHLMQPPTTSYPHGYSNNRHGSSTSVKSHFYCPSRDGQWKPVTAHAIPGTVPPLIPLEAEYDENRTPEFSGLGLIHSPSTHLDPSSTRPRPTAGQQGSKAYVPQDPESFHHLILYVTMVSGDGRPFSGHVATAASTALDKTSLLRHPRRLCLLLTL
jgi:hypothetical protein